MRLSLPLTALLLASCVEESLLDPCQGKSCPEGLRCEGGSCVLACVQTSCADEPLRCGSEIDGGCGARLSCECPGTDSCVKAPGATAGLCCPRQCAPADCGTPDHCGGLCSDGCDRWEAVDPGPGPGARHSAAAAYDPERGVLVLFGGARGDRTFLGDTWELGATGALDASGLPVLAWTRADEPGDTRQRPSPRAYARMAWLPGAGMLLVGGKEEAGPTRGLWRWDGAAAAWELLDDPIQTLRAHHGLVRDEERDVLVLFGGESCDHTFCANSDRCAPVDDLWELDVDLARDPRVIWEQRGECLQSPLPEGAPGPRKNFGMAWDGGTGSVIVRGGIVRPLGGEDGVSGGAWAWDGEAWIALPDPQVGPLRDPAMTWDPIAGTVVFHGGFGSHWADASPSLETAEWTVSDDHPAGSWLISRLEESATVPEPRDSPAFAGGEALGGLVYFGGTYFGDHDEAFRVVRR